jgi:hypothetical protein
MEPINDAGTLAVVELGRGTLYMVVATANSGSLAAGMECAGHGAAQMGTTRARSAEEVYWREEEGNWAGSRRGPRAPGGIASREPSPYLASGRGRIASKIASLCFHESVETAFWCSFLFLPIENGFREVVVVALTQKNRCHESKPSRQDNEKRKKRTYNGAPRPLCTRANDVRPMQKSTTTAFWGSFLFCTDRKWV